MEIRLAGKYLLQQTIGQGGFADVYKAQEIKTGQIKAIKLERSMAGDMLFYEGRILQMLKDVPGLPRVYDSGFEGDFNFLAMDYCGFSLSSILSLCGGKFTSKVVKNNYTRQFVNLVSILFHYLNKYTLAAFSIET